MDGLRLIMIMHSQNLLDAVDVPHCKKPPYTPTGSSVYIRISVSHPHFKPVGQDLQIACVIFALDSRLVTSNRLGLRVLLALPLDMGRHCQS